MTDNDYFVLTIGILSIASYLFYNYIFDYILKSDNLFIRIIYTLLDPFEDGFDGDPGFLTKIYRIMFFAVFWLFFILIIKFYVIGFDE